MSTYNKNLPKPSQICFINSDRSKRETTIIMPYKGTIPSGVSYIGWRQSSYTYSYQVQYYVRVRLNPDKQFATGAEYSKTDWKYMNSSWSGNVNTMNKCVAKETYWRYYRYYNFAGRSLMTAGSYDRMDIVVRVRSFNSAKKQHGDWVTETLRVKCKPDVKVHKIVALADGGFRLFLNTGGWKRGDSEVRLNELWHTDKTPDKTGRLRRENKVKIVAEVGAIGTEEASGYPYVEIKGENLNTDFHENERITFKGCKFRTVDGVDVSLDGTYKIADIDAVINEPSVVVDKNEDDGVITATISKRDTNDDWDDVKCWMLADDKRYDAFYQSGTDDDVRVYKFMPPLDVELKLRVGITNNLGGKFAEIWSSKTRENLRPLASKGRVLINYTDGTDIQPNNGVFYGSKTVAMNYEVEYSSDAQRPYEKELPLGRSRPVAFLGEGLEKNISVKGSIDASEDEFFSTVAFSSHKDWLEFEEQQGIVLLRLPKGIIYTALCTRVNISHEDETDETRAIDLAFEEVEI